MRNSLGTASQARVISNYLQSPSTGISWIPISTSSKGQDRDGLYPYSSADYASASADGKHDNSLDRTFQDYKQQDSYGGDGGYGMQNSVAFSALGLMSFLFFLRMISDTIGTLNGGIGGPIGPIRKRQQRTVQGGYIPKLELAVGDKSLQMALKLIDETGDDCKPAAQCLINQYFAWHYHDTGTAVGRTLVSQLQTGSTKESSRRDTKLTLKTTSEDGRLGRGGCAKYLSMCFRNREAAATKPKT